MPRQTKDEIDLGRHADFPELEKQVGRFGEDRTGLYYRLLREAAGRVVVAGIGGATVGVPGKRAARGSVTPAEAYIDPILRALRTKPNYSAPSEMIVQEVLRNMRDSLTTVDLEPLPRNRRVIRAANKVQWARQLAVQQGLLKSKEQAGFGTWALTPEGIRRAKKLA